MTKGAVKCELSSTTQLLPSSLFGDSSDRKRKSNDEQSDSVKKRKTENFREHQSRLEEEIPNHEIGMHVRLYLLESISQYLALQECIVSLLAC